MGKKEKVEDGDRRRGSVSVIGIGPGGAEHLTAKAVTALRAAECVVGYTRYVELIAPLVEGKEIFATGMTQEVQRCAKAIELSLSGRRVAVVSSGDAGIYGMAGLVLQLALEEDGPAPPIEVIPGVPAFVSAASILGAPLMHDFASISLSDLLTPWEVIEKRVEAAAAADFVIILYNPRSRSRTEGLGVALDVVGRYRAPSTPVGIVRNAAREGEEAVITTLGLMDGHIETVDMLTLLIIGNSTTSSSGGWMVTPRGYRGIGS
jgi:precorrin-3B C17-methyltransferase